MSHHDAASPPAIGPIFFWLALAGSVAMIGLGLYAVSSPSAAALAYGVPAAPDAGVAWIRATGVRDLTIGLLSLTFTVLRDRRALGLVVLVGALIPLGDGLVVLTHSPSPMPFLLVHWCSAAACLAFAFLLLRVWRG